MDMVGSETGDRAQKELGEGETQVVALGRTWLGGKQLGLKGPGGCRRQAVVLEWTQLGWRQVIGPEKTWWRVGDERLRSNGHSWVGDGQLGPKRVGRG